MKKNIKEFGSNLKKYIDHIMKLGFGELFFHFVELVIVVLIACFVYIPIGLIQDLLFSVLGIVTDVPTTIGLIINLIFSILSAVLAASAFMYMFNRRYEDLKNGKDSEKKSKANDALEIVKDEFEMPVKKDKKDE